MKCGFMHEYQSSASLYKQASVFYSHIWQHRICLLHTNIQICLLNIYLFIGHSICWNKLKASFVKFSFVKCNFILFSLSLLTRYKEWFLARLHFRKCIKSDIYWETASLVRVHHTVSVNDWTLYALFYLGNISTTWCIVHLVS